MLAAMNGNSKRDFLEKYGIFIGFLAIFTLFSITCPGFFSTNNIFNLVVQSSIIGLIAIGETVVITTGGIDLSVGSLVAFVGVSLGLMLASGMSIAMAVILSLLLGAVIGLLSGIIISYGNVPAFIMTLGMMSIARGGALALNGGRPISGLPSGFDKIATADILGIPIFIFYVVVAYGIMYLVLNKMKLGRYIYAIGDNREAARLSGIEVKKIQTTAYIFSGFFAAVGAVMLTARLNYATPLAGKGFELDAIASTVIGGTALSGGKGNITGTLVGALMLGTLRNGLTLLNVSSFYQQIVIGIVIIIAVYIDKLKEE